MDRSEARQSPEPKRRNIAVIAVHGVGDQKPLESAHAIADLLQDLDIGERRETAAAPAGPCVPPAPVDPRYEPFTTRGLRINVRPVVVSNDDTPADGSIQGPFHALVDHMYADKQSRAAGGEAASRRRTPDDIATTFMRGQLRCYGGDTPEETYETVRLEGTRTKDGGPARTVHVYELYWADLSRLKAGLLSIFTELYQLLFHLSSLGTHVVDAEASQHLTGAWHRFRKTQSAAAFTLALPIPVLNIFLLAVTGVVVATAALYKVPPNWGTVAALAILFAAFTAFVGWLCWKAKHLSRAKWIAPIIAWLAGVGAVAIFRASIDVRVGHVAAQVVLVVLAGVLVDLTLRAYDARRPGALKQGRIAGTVVVIAGMIAAAVKGAPPDAYSRILTGWLRVFEVVYASLTVSWSAFAVLAFLAFLTGELAVRGVGNPKERKLATKSLWTARLMLSLPASAFLAVTLAGWALLSYALVPMMDGLAYTPILPLGTNPSLSVNSLGQTLLDTAGKTALPVILVASAIAALPAVWGMLPVVVSEVWPPALHRAREAAYSNRLGRWLTHTFGGLMLSGMLLVAAMTFVFPLLGADVLAVRFGMPNYFDRFPSLLTAVQAAGAASGLIFAWLFAIRGNLKKLALGFAPALDILLDVDNWLREHPLSRNPKARICGRYVSLLRYVCQWNDPSTGDGYDAIVIIAHSQGTVITADLLRFLAIEGDPQLRRLEGEVDGQARIPIYLFTMGCPLRQLYGERFPRLYAWATHDDDASMTTWSQDDLAVPPRSSVVPDPRTLRVDKWINAYRSGDYVGRYLWRTEPCGYLWTPDFSHSRPATSMDKESRLEFCIGAGAHTHYWDATARPIAWTLDDLIAGA